MSSQLKCTQSNSKLQRSSAHAAFHHQASVHARCDVSSQVIPTPHQCHTPIIAGKHSLRDGWQRGCCQQPCLGVMYCMLMVWRTHLQIICHTQKVLQPRFSDCMYNAVQIRKMIVVVMHSSNMHVTAARTVYIVMLGSLP